MNSPLPTLDELLTSAQVVALPTRTRFRGIRMREAVLFTGPQGTSEFSPFLEYEDHEASNWLAAAVEFAWGETPAPLRTRIPVNATVPAVTANEVPAVLAQFPGCTVAKVKVAEPGGSLSDDVARVRSVRETMGEAALIRVDANGGWSVDDAIHALRALAKFNIEYVEQPCASIAELVQLRQRVRRGDTPPVRIAADESVRKVSDPIAVARSGAADLLVVKAQPLGGISRALDIIQQAGLPVIVSSALETSIGIAMGAYLAAALPEHATTEHPGLAGACGLGTVALLRDDVVSAPLLPSRGEIEVRRVPLDQEAVTRHAASPERAQWWRERIARCYQILETDRAI